MAILFLALTTAGVKAEARWRRYFLSVVFLALAFFLAWKLLLPIGIGLEILVQALIFAALLRFAWRVPLHMDLGGWKAAAFTSQVILVVALLAVTLSLVMDLRLRSTGGIDSSTFSPRAWRPAPPGESWSSPATSRPSTRP